MVFLLYVRSRVSKVNEGEDDDDGLDGKKSK